MENVVDGMASRCEIQTEPVLGIGAAAGGPGEELFVVSGVVQLSDGRVAVANTGSNEVRVFDERGRFLKAFGSEGDGPGEFRTLKRVWVLPGDTLWVGDQRPWRFAVFGPDGEWVRSVRPDLENPGTAPGDIAVLDDGRSAIVVFARVGFDADFGDREAEILVYDPEGGLAGDLGDYSGGRWGIVRPRSPIHARDALAVPRYLESFPWMAGAGDRIVISDGQRAEVKVFGGRPLGLELIVRFDVPDQTIMPSDVELARERRRVAYAIIDPDDEARIPVADSVPAVTGLRVGRDERIWVREFPRSQSGEESWLAFHPDGTLECRLRLPSWKDIFEFGGDYVLVHHQDDLGVERVLKFSLSKPEPSRSARP